MNPPAPSTAPSATPLRPGIRLTDFEVREVIGVGGFGIVYRAFDHTLERDVALKEYMPAALADRTATMHVSLRSSANEETFKLGLRSFVNEARLLARFDHPSLVKVYRFWEANGTAYMVMPLYRGRTLKELVASGAGPRDEAALRKVLLPLLGALERLHDDGVFHRDISPDNIVIEPDGHPVLLDFGAARHVIADRSQNLTAILKPSYAPIEQYAEAGGVKQGPWTDFYALGATLHFLICAKAPPPATARTIDDFMVPLVQQAPPGCSAAFLQVLDWMLRPRPNDRPRSVAELRSALSDAAAAQAAQGAPPDDDATVVLAPRGDLEAATVMLPRGHNAPAPADTPRTTVRQPTPPVHTLALPPRPQTEPQPRTTMRPPTAAPGAPAAAQQSRWTVVAAVAGYSAIGIGALWWFFGTRGPAAPAALPSDVAASAPPLVVAAASTPRLNTAPAAPAVASAPTEASAPPLPAIEPAPAPAPVAAVAAPPPGTAPVVRKPAPIRPAAAPTPAVVVPEPAPPPQASPEASVVRPAPSRPSVPAPPPVAAVNPKDACGGRMLVAYWNCISRECAKPEAAPHPECVKWRDLQARQRNSETQ